MPYRWEREYMLMRLHSHELASFSPHYLGSRLSNLWHYNVPVFQAENIQSEIQKLRELIDQSESIILINLDSQRNIMLRLSLQLEMGMFSAAIAGLIGMAFGMNLESSLEEVSMSCKTHRVKSGGPGGETAAQGNSPAHALAAVLAQSIL